MRVFILIASLAVANTVQAAEVAFANPQVVVVPGQRPGEPMAWKFSLLRAGEAQFKQHEARLAPQASLAFKLPRGEEAQDDIEVGIVSATGRIGLATASAAAFTLPVSTEAVDSDAMVVTNRHFRKGSFLHPLVQVRSPGLADGVKRMGDLRLACAVQVTMAKAQDFKFRALLAAARLFGDLCQEMAVNNIGAPASTYDTITIEDGGRRMALPRAQADGPKLGDTSWSDDARISYSLHGETVF